MQDIKKQSLDELLSDKMSRLASVIDGSDSERLRLSRELHDGLGQALVAIKLKVESLVSTDAQKTKKGLEELRFMLNNTIDEIRRISNNLMPAVLTEFGLVTALANLCREVSENSDIEVNFVHDNIPANIDKKFATYIYRIVQEGLNNIVKHSCTKYAYVALKRDSEYYVLEIKDNGKGMNMKELTEFTGMGLSNIKARTKLLSGDLIINSATGKGTELIVKIPARFNKWKELR